ncbi:uncharacterized protein LOC129692558 [Psammomys obesus]|uniref:uncharacterized protein LOC129692558 n=1 Tax=Psammomys obesus TaxID=48139 RepID=UPI002453249F|nr:uncharacterized protein LOC129692558 [Psammomys obesus]
MEKEIFPVHEQPEVGCFVAAAEEEDGGRLSCSWSGCCTDFRAEGSHRRLRRPRSLPRVHDHVCVIWWGCDSRGRLQNNHGVLRRRWTGKLTPTLDHVFGCRSGSAAAATHRGAGALPSHGGMMVRQSFTTGRSRSASIYDCMAATYQEGRTERECPQLTADAVASAMEPDGSGGGLIRLAAIQQSGVRRRQQWFPLLPYCSLLQTRILHCLEMIAKHG